jgi:hypothetical protein
MKLNPTKLNPTSIRLLHPLIWLPLIDERIERSGDAFTHRRADGYFSPSA